MGNRLTVKQQLSGFPWAQMLVVSIMRFSEPMAFTSLFPYLYFMVRDFKIAPEEAYIPKYAGFLASSFALFQTMFSFPWVNLSNRYGRKPALLLAQTGLCVALVLLGFAKKFYVALLARILMGVFSGYVGVIRTVIGEIAHERRHEAMAFSTLPLLFQVGCVIGPVIGGYLSFPRDKQTPPETWPGWLLVLLAKYPYCLPNLLLTTMMLFGNVIAVLFLEETHPTLKYERDRGLEVGDWILNTFCRQHTNPRPWKNKFIGFEGETPIQTPVPTENSPLLVDIESSHSANSKKACAEEENNVEVHTYAVTPVSEAETEIERAHDGCREDSLLHLILHTDVFHPMLASFLIELHLIIYNEFFPVFLAHDLIKNKLPDGTTELASKFPWKILGGIGFHPEQTGRLLSVTGVAGCCILLFVFPVLDGMFDRLKLFRTFIKLYPLIYMLVPYVVFLQKDNIPSWCTYAYLYCITGLNTFTGSTATSEAILLVHNISPVKHRAAINGAVLSIGAASRFIGPMIWGGLISWSQEKEMVWISWWALALTAVGAILQSYWIPKVREY